MRLPSNPPTAWAVVAIGLLAGCTGFREVVPGVYRCPQPEEDQLTHYIAQHGLRTVVCLRGGSAAGPSHRAAEAAGISLWRVPMSATRLPTPATLHGLWQVARSAPRPLLLHCRAGVDRTGLAAALLVLHDTGDLARARAQLALLPHGHVAFGRTSAMDEVLDRYAPHHGVLSFPQWIDTVYAATHVAVPPLPEPVVAATTPP
jgi:protein tyrosine phosphatase (PTP) superfamily phosphohydrolase (DUF442 family)